MMDLHTIWNDFSRTYSFFSNHPGGGQFALCDGSVVFVSDDIDLNLYRGLATISSGEVVSPP